MRRRVSPAAVGVFVIGAVALAAVAVVFLASGSLFQTRYRYVLYFQGDVNGLRVGAPVKFKGVEVGRVTEILLAFGNRSIAGTGFRIPVLIELQPQRIITAGGKVARLDDPASVKEAIRTGLRAQLAFESVVTGLLYVSLDIMPETPAHFVLPPGSRYLEIPTVQTPLEQARASLTRVITKLGRVDLDKLADSLSQMVEATRALITDPKLKQAIDSLAGTTENLDRTATSIRLLAEHADAQLGQVKTSVVGTSNSATRAFQEATKTLQEAQVTLASLQASLGQGSPLNYQLGRTLEDVSAAARSMRTLADYLDRNPSSLVRGRPVSDEAGQ